MGKKLVIYPKVQENIRKFVRELPPINHFLRKEIRKTEKNNNDNFCTTTKNRKKTERKATIVNSNDKYVNDNKKTEREKRKTERQERKTERENRKADKKVKKTDLNTHSKEKTEKRINDRQKTVSEIINKETENPIKITIEHEPDKSFETESIRKTLNEPPDLIRFKKPPALIPCTILKTKIPLIRIKMKL
jgi:ABC-type proline/glycine betaine transport system ATPase subunit